MIVIVPHYKDRIIGAYTDMNRAKRAAKEVSSFVAKRVKYLSFEVNDGVIDEVEQLEDWVGKGE